MKKMKYFMLGLLFLLLAVPIQASAKSDDIIWKLEHSKNISEVEDWRRLSDEELTEVINYSSEFQVAQWLCSLTEDEFYDVIERETPLKYPVYQFTDVDGEEQKKEVLAEHYYEYALSSLASPMAWEHASGTYQGTASGKFYFRIKQDGTKITDLTVRVSNVTAGGSMSGKYTISGTYGTWSTSSVKSEKEREQWAGIVLNGSYTKPAHYYTLWESKDTGLGRYDPWNADYTDYTLSTTHRSYDNADSVRIQVNGANAGLIDGYEDVYAKGTIELVRYSNALKINPNGGTHGGKTSTYTLATKTCKNTTSVSNPTRVGYRFTGWTLSNGSGASGSLSGTTFTHCNSGAKFSTSTDVYSNTTATSTLTANWVAQNYLYEVRHYKQLSDGSYPSTPDEVVTGEAGCDSQFTGEVKTYAGYISPAAQTITIGSGSNIISYYYEKSNFDLSIKPNGGTWRGNTNVVTFTIERGQSMLVEDPAPPAGANVTLYYHDDAETVLTESIQKVFTGWEKAGGGTFDAATRQFTSGNGDAVLTAQYTQGTITLPTLNREHYDFIGWDTNPDIDPDVEAPDYLPGVTIPVNTNMELHAIWKVHFKLNAQIERVLSPHDPVFENGEKGILKIPLIGFVNKVEVTFPYELNRYDDTLNQTHILEPKLVDEVIQEFHIPLYSVEDGYRVTVRAYNEKGDCLTVYPALTISGTILDDFRTRLR